ncbi:hypothetical protein VNI00_015878 [Paramarasmius palmivorus]|uniref:Uncharacterized protein n=1 Tax=Paramarasmius palmivorus TaxID=297713 RepID=A0AAW0BHK6_9AGAR
MHRPYLRKRDCRRIKCSLARFTIQQRQFLDDHKPVYLHHRHGTLESAEAEYLNFFRSLMHEWITRWPSKRYQVSLLAHDPISMFYLHYLRRRIIDHYEMRITPNEIMASRLERSRASTSLSPPRPSPVIASVEEFQPLLSSNASEVAAVGSPPTVSLDLEREL